MNIFGFFFSGIIEEDRILRVLTNLYNSDRLLLPVDSYDGKILPELKDLYRNLFNEAVSKSKDEEVFSLKSAKIRMFIPYQHFICIIVCKIPLKCIKHFKYYICWFFNVYSLRNLDILLPYCDTCVSFVKMKHFVKLVQEHLKKNKSEENVNI